ncbi:MAG: DUF86 domain-containing protein [Gammaproteobacteria bacterium]
MTENRLPDYLDHMIEAAQQACSYVEGMDKEDFLADKRTQQAVILNLVIIGEAATKLIQNHSAFLDQHADVPWRSMKGMRNRIAHGYFEINLDVVWETVQTALPQLLDLLPAIRQHVDD